MPRARAAQVVITAVVVFHAGIHGVVDVTHGVDAASVQSVSASTHSQMHASSQTNGAVRFQSTGNKEGMRYNLASPASGKFFQFRLVRSAPRRGAWRVRLLTQRSCEQENYENLPEGERVLVSLIACDLHEQCEGDLLLEGTMASRLPQAEKIRLATDCANMRARIACLHGVYSEFEIDFGESVKIGRVVVYSNSDPSEPMEVRFASSVDSNADLADGSDEVYTPGIAYSIMSATEGAKVPPHVEVHARRAQMTCREEPTATGPADQSSR